METTIKISFKNLKQEIIRQLKKTCKIIENRSFLIKFEALQSDYSTINLRHGVSIN
jgi:hypothetical protein